MTEQEAAVDGVLHHPRFQSAFKKYVDGYITLRKKSGPKIRMMDEQNRLILCNCILYLHYRFLQDGSEYAAPQRLRDQMVTLGLYSRRGAELALEELKTAKLLTVEPMTQDRRRMRLVPSADFIAFYRNHTRDVLDVIDFLNDNHDLVTVFDQDPSMFERMVLILAGEWFKPQMSLRDRPETFGALMSRNGLYMFLAQLMSKALEVNPDDPAKAVLHLKQEDAAQFCMVSRSQFRLIREAVVGAGLIHASDEKPSVYQITPLLVDSFARHRAETILFVWYGATTALNGAR